MENTMEFLSNQRTTAMTNRTIAKLREEYANRGIVLSVKKAAEAQKACEVVYMHALPLVYRMSFMSDSEIEANCRHGKNFMNSRDLVEYIEESRHLRMGSSSQKVALINEIADHTQRTAFPARMKIKRLAERVQSCVETLEVTPINLQGENLLPLSEKSKKKHFSASVAASIAAVMISALTLLSGGVLFKSVKTQVGRIQNETAQLKVEAEIAETALLNGTAVAPEQSWQSTAAAMEAEILQAQNTSNGSAVLMESYDAGENTNIGLSALLSAFGIKR